MKRFLGMALVGLFVAAPALTSRAGEQEAKAVLDKAVKALGGEEKLSKVKAFTTKAKGTVSFEGNDNPFTGETTIQGLDKFRSEFEGEFNGNRFKGVTVLNGDRAWRRFGDDAMSLDGDALANEKRVVYLQLVPVLILPLKGKDFKVESAPEEKVDDKPAAVVKATGPDGKEFTLYFDKESGLPVKQTATVAGFRGGEFTQETTYHDYKDFDGLKKATKTRSTRDGQRFVDAEVTEFKVVDDVAPETFSEPK